jgi:uncharacterized protein (DUF3820 family)
MEIPAMDAEEALLNDWRRNLAEALELIGRWHMPFGKFGPKHFPPHGVPLYDLPDEYLLWFQRTGFPAGRLGQVLRVVCEIRLAGAEAVFEPLRRAAGGRRPLRKKRQTNFDFSEGELPLE